MMGTVDLVLYTLVVVFVVLIVVMIYLWASELYYDGYHSNAHIKVKITEEEFLKMYSASPNLFDVCGDQFHIIFETKGKQFRVKITNKKHWYKTSSQILKETKRNSELLIFEQNKECLTKLGRECCE